MPRPSPSSEARPAQLKVVALGGGHGLAAVVRALRDEAVQLTVVVTIADDGGSSGELRRRREGPAVGDLRRSLIASSREDVALARTLGRPLTVNRLGRHPIGNLVLRSVADAFGDLERGSEWLGEQLGIRARVLPATAEPVSLVAETEHGQLIFGESAINCAGTELRRLRFDPDRPRVPAAVTAAIEDADWVVLAPGSLFTSVLAACVVPDVVSALEGTSARVLWVANLRDDGRETAGMSGSDHVETLRRHGISPHVILFDPDAELRFDPGALTAGGAAAVARRVQGSPCGGHDPSLLRGVLADLLAAGGHIATRQIRDCAP